MAISRKPTTPTENKPAPVDVEALISKGGSVASSESRVEQSKAVRDIVFTLKLPGDIGAEVDAARTKDFKISRQQWIMEAIVQRLKSEREE